LLRLKSIRFQLRVSKDTKKTSEEGPRSQSVLTAKKPSPLGQRELGGSFKGSSLGSVWWLDTVPQSYFPWSFSNLATSAAKSAIDCL